MIHQIGLCVLFLLEIYKKNSQNKKTQNEKGKGILMNKLDQLNTVIKDNSRFYKINESDLIWIYDAHVHNVFSLSRKLYNALFVEKNQSLSDITEKLSIKENSYFLNIINNILQNETDNTNSQQK